MKPPRQSILIVQPESCRAPMPQREIPGNFSNYVVPAEHWLRVLFLDPSDFYARFHESLNPYQRIQSIGVDTLFPKIIRGGAKICACGCGKRLPGKRSRWATDLCQWHAYKIFEIIYGRTETIIHFLRAYYGETCASCGRSPREIYDQDIRPKQFRSTIPPALYVDHIFPVSLGGGGSWLTNFQLLCNSCHRKKTNSDFGWKNGQNEEISRQNTLEI